jgi:hypothetical protein
MSDDTITTHSQEYTERVRRAAYLVVCDLCKAKAGRPCTGIGIRRNGSPVNYVHWVRKSDSIRLRVPKGSLIGQRRMRMADLEEEKLRAIMIRPKGESGWYVVGTIDGDNNTWANVESEILATYTDNPDEVWELAIKEYTQEELDALPEFDGW